MDKVVELKLNKEQQDKVQLLIDYMNNKSRINSDGDIEWNFKIAVNFIFLRGLEAIEDNGQLSWDSK